MDKIINLKLLANPLNWLIIWLMLLLAAILGHFILSWAGVSHTPQPANTPKPSLNSAPVSY